MRYVNCSASDYWNLACTEPVTQLWLTHQTRNVLCLVSWHFIQHLYQHPTLSQEDLIPLSLSLSHLEVYLGHLFPLIQIQFSFQHHFKCKYHVFMVSANSVFNSSLFWPKFLFTFLYYFLNYTHHFLHNYKRKTIT